MSRIPKEWDKYYPAGERIVVDELLAPIVIEDEVFIYAADMLERYGRGLIEKARKMREEVE